jgi:flavorubredoxin
MDTKLTDNVFWVGFVDWSVRDFHGYTTARGSTYNAYLVKSQKTALIDTVKGMYAGDLIANVKAQVPLESVDYIVCNHAEPDHAGGLPATVQACPNATVVCNAKCKDALEHHFDVSGWKFQVVNDAETLSLGGKTLQFFDTPMVHWPESMVTYLVEDAILFSMDAFGQHYASGYRFDDESDLCEVMQEAKTYYANIVLPYARPVAAALARLGGLKLAIVAPSHGVIWRSHFAKIVAAYQAWMVSKPTKKVVIVFSSMWNSTRQMAEAVAAGAEEFPVEVKLIDAAATSDTNIVADVMDCAAFAAGSPTLNMSILPRMAATLTYLRGLKPMGKSCFAFGSFGWASKGCEEVAQYLQAMQMTPVCEPVACRFVPDAATLEKCRAAGRALAAVALKA